MVLSSTNNVDIFRFYKIEKKKQKIINLLLSYTMNSLIFHIKYIFSLNIKMNNLMLIVSVNTSDFLLEKLCLIASIYVV